MTLFTKQEKQVIYFLLGTLTIGYGIKAYNQKNLYEGFNPISIEEKEDFKQIAETAFSKSSGESQKLTPDLNSSLPEKDYKPTVEIININTAQKQDLMQLPIVGVVTAERIMRYREDFGPFISADDLLKVKGIGPITLEKILPKIKF